MKRRIRETFDMIHAEEDLKERTREFLAEKTENYTKTRQRGRGLPYARLVPAVCLLLAVLCFGGYRYYFKPVSVISIDINPSLELDVNRFDRIVAVKEYNKEGEDLAESLEIMFLNYTDALEQILENKSVQAYLSQDETMSIVVTGEDETKTRTVYDNIEKCTAEQENTHCYHADSQQLAEAHEAGLSYGKYMAYLELLKLDPDIMPEEIQGMTMREIRDRIEALSGDGNQPGENTGNAGNGGNYEGCSEESGGRAYSHERSNEKSSGHHGKGQGYGRQHHGE